MAMIDEIVLTLTITYTVLHLITGSYILVKYFRIKNLRLIPLSLFFLLNFLESVLLYLAFPFILYKVIIFLPNLCLILFTYYTFHSDQKNYLWIFVSFFILLKLIDFLLFFYFRFSIPMTEELKDSQIPLYYLNLSVVAAVILLSNLWLAISSLSYYKRIKEEKVKPWIKFRYVLIGLASIILSANGIAYLFMPPTVDAFSEPMGFIIGIIIIINSLIFSFSSIIAWVMPQWLKQFINRNYEGGSELEIPEKQLIQTIKNQLNEEGS